MSHLQLSTVAPAQPSWKRRFNIVFCGLILSGAAVVNVTTQMHLSGRIPDWAGLTWIIPIASWLYSIQCTVNWASTPHGSTDRKAAFHAVLISVGIAEAMNLGEHIWAHVLQNGKLDGGVIPSLLVGSLPALFDFLSIESAARVLSAPHVPAAAEISEDDLPAAMEISEEVPADETVPSVPEPRKEPVPEDLPEDKPEPILPTPEPAPEIPAQREAEDDETEDRPAPQKAPEDKLSEKRAARRDLIDEVALVIVDLMLGGKTEDEIKKTVSARNLIERFPQHTYTDRNWLNIRNAAMPVANELIKEAV